MSAVFSQTIRSRYIGLAAGCFLCACAMAQVPQIGNSEARIATDPATLAPNNSASKKSTEVKKVPWLELTGSQQRALAPLSPLWSSLSEAQKKKWLAISKNFAALPESEQIVLHSRMAEWATLTPQQRMQARLNYGETNKIPLTEKKAHWDAYQALSDEEKKKLSDSQPPPVSGAAPAKRPASSDKLSHVHSPTGQPPLKGKTPGVKDLDQKTLLPSNKPLPSKVDVPAA